MEIAFTKMHGLGNDFVVINKLYQTIDMTTELVRFIADRRFGVGCDQLLLVEPPRDAQTDFYYRIFNADGSEVEQCGNGARCFARFVRDHRLSDKDEIKVGTAKGPIYLYIEADGHVRVNMGRPRFAPKEIPFESAVQALSYPLRVADQTIEIGAVSMGNPHAVIMVDDVDTAPVQTLGPIVEKHPLFPKRVNAGFMQIRDRGHIALRVFERGVGETLACGTGACAAVVVGRLRGLLDEQVNVSLPGGQLVISWGGNNESVWMTGPATRVFDGRMTL